MSDRTEWLAWRKKGIGASDVAGILGLSNFSSPWSVWADKVGLLPPRETTERQRIGLVLEDAIGKLFTARTGLYVCGEQTQCVHPVNDWQRCTVDGFAFDGDLDEEHDDLVLADFALGIMQAKTDYRRDWPDGIPEDYQAQAQWEMHVTGSEREWFAVLHGGFRFEVYEIERDQADIDVIVERVEAFWFDHVQPGNPPPVDGTSPTTLAITSVWPEHVPGTVTDLTELARLIEERDQRLNDRRVAQARLDEIDNELRAAMGENEVGVVDGEPTVTYRTQTRKPYQVAEKTFRVLRVKKGHAA